MAYVMNVWEHPAQRPQPADAAGWAAERQLLRQSAVARQNPRFLSLARALRALFPSPDDDPDSPWLEDEDGVTTEPVLNIGLNLRSPDVELAHRYLTYQATRHGLVVADGQSGEVWPPAPWPGPWRPLPDLRRPRRPIQPEHEAHEPFERSMREALGGNPEAMFRLAWHYFGDPASTPADDLPIGVEWFRRSAEDGSVNGSSMWGYCLLDLEVVPEDMPAARHHLERAVAGAVEPAEFLLARMLLDGWGGPADPARGVMLYTRAAARGDADAMFNLANCLRNGAGTPPDRLAALALFHCAHARGSLHREADLAASPADEDKVKRLIDAMIDCARIPEVLAERRRWMGSLR